MATTSIEQFTLSLLAYKGALIEAGDRSAGVLLGTELAAVLGMNEFQRLVFDPSLDGPGTLRVDYDSPSFETMGRLADSMGKLACVRIGNSEQTLPLKAIDPDRELDRALTLHNGVLRLLEYARAETLYFCFFLQYDVMADERSGGVTEVWINPATRSIPRFESLLERVDAGDAPAPEDLGSLAVQAWGLAAPAATLSIGARVRSFSESLNRRRDRDLRRMGEYYRTIDSEIRRKIARLTTKEEVRKSEIQRLEATAAAYQARAADLMERYRMRVSVTGLGVLAATIPTYRFRVQLLRRTRKTEKLFTWNPFERGMESRCCDACARATKSAVLCDDQVHYLCLDCLAPCPICAKVFCRACHPRCPRGHR